MSSVLEHIRLCAEQDSQRIVLQDELHGMTCAELHAAILGLRQWVEQQQCRVIAIAGDNSLGWIVSDLALLGLPVRVVPIPGFFSSAQIRHVFAEANVDAVLASSMALHHLPISNPTRFRMLNTELDIAVGIISHGTRYSGEYEKVTFTSGSTGTPRGVRLNIATLEATAHAIADTLADLEIASHLSVLPYATLLENVAGIYAPLLRNVRVHVRRMEQLGLASPEHFNPFMLASVISQVQPDATILVPQLLLALLTLVQRGALASAQFKFIAVGGGKVAPALLQQAEQMQLPVFEGYGLSECGSVVALNRAGARKAGSVGKPLPHVRIRIAPDGEIHVSGAVMTGYLGDETGELREIATGDLGILDSDGYLLVSGRKKSMFITAFGRNVNPEWVESELLSQIAIRQVAVFGEAQPFNTALIVPRSGFSSSAVEQAVAEANYQLPDYARIGRIILIEEPFSTTNGLATANGRVRRTEVEHHFKAQLQAESKHEFFPTTATAD